jgi:hypothetical protein
MTIIDENGKKHHLQILDQNGFDWTEDFVSGFFDTNKDNEYIGLLIDIAWWKEEIELYKTEKQ